MTALFITITKVLRQRVIIAAPTFCFLIAALGTNLSAAPVSYENASRVADALRQLDRFKTSHAFKDLESAILTLQLAFEVRTFTVGNFVAKRRELVSSWAQILKAIQGSYDPKFNPNDPRQLPVICLPPPPEPNGHQFPSCVDPNEIQDPRTRAAYVAALQLNAAKAKKAAYYSDLSNLDDEAMASLEVRLNLLRKVAPEGVPRDSAALDQILQRAGLSEARRKELHPYFSRGEVNESK
jgi:hypothetical protein